MSTAATSSVIMSTFSVDLLSKPATLTDAQLVDEISTLRRHMKVLERREKLLVEALKSRHKNFEFIQPGTEDYHINGREFGCTPIMVVQKRLDSEAVKEEMGEAWWEDHCKELRFVQLRFGAIEEPGSE